MDPTEELVSPGAETEINAPVLTEQPEVVTPGNSEAEQADQPPKDEANPHEKAAKALQRRVDRVTAARYQAEARAAEADRRAQELAQRLAQYEQPQEPQQQAADPVAIAKEIARIERVTEKANAIAKDGEKRFENFKDAVQTVNREAGALFDRYGRPTGFGEAVLSADDPAAVIHALHADPDLAAELADLTPIQQARRIARLEVEMSKPKEPPRSNAPRPITPVKAVARDDNALSDDLPLDEWLKRRNKQARGK